MNSIRYLPLLVALLLLPACSRQETKPADPKASKTPTARKYQAVADVPEDARKNAEDFALGLEKSIRDGEIREMKAAFDATAIVEGITEGISGSSLRLKQFKGGMQTGMGNSLSQIARSWAQQDVKFKGLAIYRGTLAARFRFVSEEGGISVFDLVVRTNQQGRLAIVNFCNHAMGYDLIEQSRQAAAPMLAELDKGFLERVLNKPDITADQIKQFAALSEKARAGDVQGAAQIYQSLPDSLRNTMAATCLYITVLQRGEDTDAYKQALQDAAARFKSASFQFMLVDAYALDKKFGKAADCIDAFMQVVGRDAVLLALKSLMQNANGDVPAARQTLREAFELEPDSVYVHTKGLDVLLAARDFPAVRDSLNFLEKDAGKNFKGQLTDPIWGEFKKAPESKPWR
jgi:thioredoxin-like negative regulator of GroEL